MSNKLEQDAYQDDLGIWRWKSNDRVPFDDMLEECGVSIELRHECAKAREADTAEFLEAYIANQEDLHTNPERRDELREQQYEMRAAFGPGQEVVNVITGRRTIT